MTRFDSSQAFSVAAIQMKAGSDPAQNRARALSLLDRAAAQGDHKLYVLPEAFAYRGVPEGLLSTAARIADGRFLEPFREFAAQRNAWILLGSLPEAGPGGKVWNTAYLVDPKFKIAGRYRKIHRFRLLDRSEVDETRFYLAGKEPMLCRIGRVQAGIAICFDLRFPALFAGYRARGARLLLCPSAFTRQTGESHWEVLVRARAIENQCYVVAPNQYGLAADGIRCHGHSLIADPWGRVLAEGPGDADAALTARFDWSLLEKIRKTLPCEPKIGYK